MSVDDSFIERLARIAGSIQLGMECEVKIGHDDEHEPGRWYFQIKCWRRDVITGEHGFGYGGKAYLSPHATDSELIQTVFGLYKGYWEHEARETFVLVNSAGEGRRPFGPAMRRWRGVVAVEGVVTVDGRLIEPTAIEWSDDPIPLMHAGTPDGGGDWSRPMLGYIETLERRERTPHGAVIVAEGVLFDTATLPASLDLSAFVVSGEHDIAGEGVDYPLALTRCVLKQVVVGNPKVWDECVLEVLDEG